MTSPILNLADAPTDPIERIMWLDGVNKAVARELDTAFEEAYYNARIEGRFEAAVEAGHASRKRALAWTRARNQAQGRPLRWGDGADPSSTAYRG